ncbi:MAG: hypothetical protein DSM106950_19685 [Stigonema ocellatum SAG 48.90 = DSM 106950]|nr:hypothetical protein [Stigonema ocellatum SAG 48.90 = DSM 106950]
MIQQTLSSEKTDVIVIGSGIGGLSLPSILDQTRSGTSCRNQRRVWSFYFTTMSTESRIQKQELGGRLPERE